MSHSVAVSQALMLVAAARKEKVWQPLISHPFLERHPVMERFLLPPTSLAFSRFWALAHLAEPSGDLV